MTRNSAGSSAFEHTAQPWQLPCIPAAKHAAVTPPPLPPASERPSTSSTASNVPPPPALPPHQCDLAGSAFSAPRSGATGCTTLRSSSVLAEIPWLPLSRVPQLDEGIIWWPRQSGTIRRQQGQCIRPAPITRLDRHPPDMCDIINEPVDSIPTWMGCCGRDQTTREAGRLPAAAVGKECGG